MWLRDWIRKLNLSPIVFLAIGVGFLMNVFLIGSIAADRFSFINLADAPTPEAFDDLRVPAGEVGEIDLSVPTIDAGFEKEVLRGVSGDGDDRRVFLDVVRWTHEQLKPNAVREEVALFEANFAFRPSDALSASRQGATAFCSTYARVAASAASVLGVTARVIELEGHTVVEAYDRERRQWMAADPTLPGLLVESNTDRILSFAEAAVEVRGGRQIDIMPVAELHPVSSMEDGVQYLHKVLGRELLAYVDGEATFERYRMGARLCDWVSGRIRGVRLLSKESSGRNWKRTAIAVVNGGLFLILAGSVLIGRVRRRSARS